MRARASFAALLLVASGVVLAAPAAGADDKDAVTEMARRRFQEGVKFFDQKRYDEARAAFLQAYALKHHPAVLLNLAQSELRSGHVLEAARHFSGYLRDSASASAAEKGEAEKGLAAARTKLARIAVTAPAGAEVLVDGESVGQAPLPEPVDVMPGAHNLEAKLGNRSATATATTALGKPAAATLAFDGAGSAAVVAAPPASASPAVVAPPSAAPAPPAPAPAPPAEPAEVRAPAVEPVKEPAPVASDAGVQITSEGREPFFKWLGHNGVGIVGIGITGIGLGVFAGFAIAGQQAATNADAVAFKIRTQANLDMLDRQDLCAPPVQAGYEKACNVLSDNMSKRDTDRTVATVAGVAAGVGLVATLAAYLLSSKEPGQGGQAMIVPTVGPKHAGIGISGSF